LKLLIVSIADRINPCITTKASASPCDLLIVSLLAASFAELDHHSNFSAEITTLIKDIAVLVMAIAGSFEAGDHLVVL